jgi:histidyl-tRNA synthetase
LILDKLDKIGLEAVAAELSELGIGKPTVTLIKGFVTDKNNKVFNYYEEYLAKNEQIKQGLAELQELNEYIQFLGIDSKCVFNPFLARGLEIYTGTIYEIFLADQRIKSSIGSGGRYDNAIGGLIGTEESFSTVGISFGLDVIYTALGNSIAESPLDLDFYIIPVNTQKESLLAAKYLRDKGYKVEVEMGRKKLGKALEKANKEKVRQVVIIGEEEVEKKMMKIKDMLTGEERTEAFNFEVGR